MEMILYHASSIQTTPDRRLVSSAARIKVTGQQTKEDLQQFTTTLPNPLAEASRCTECLADREKTGAVAPGVRK
jgi:hypothetical protein